MLNVLETLTDHFHPDIFIRLIKEKIKERERERDEENVNTLFHKPVGCIP